MGPRAEQALEVAITVFALLFAAVAAASEAPAPRPIVAEWGEAGSTYPECTTRAQLERETARAVGRPVFRTDEAVDVVVMVQVSGTSVAVSLFDPEGHPLGRRRLEGESCEELRDGLVLALSLMLDFTTEDVARLRENEAAEQASAESSASSPPPTAEATSSSVPAPIPPKREEPEPRAVTPRAAPRFILAADARMGLGFSSEPLLGASLGFGVMPSAEWLLEARGTYWFLNEASATDGRVALRGVEGGVAVFPLLFQLGPARARLGASGELGRFEFAGRGYAEEGSASALALRLGVASRAEAPLGPLLAQLSAHLETPIIGYRAVAADADAPREQLRSAPINAVVGMGLALPLR